MLLVLVFLLFISLRNAQSYHEIDFDGINNANLEIVNETEITQINVILTQLPIYTKLLVEGTDDINYVISVYSDNERVDRIQLAQSLNKNSVLFLTRNQIRGNKIYMDIECSSTPCSFKLSVISQEKIQLEEGEQISYYVTEHNENMEFEISLTSEKANIWSRGSKDIINTLSNYHPSSKNKNYFIISEKKVEFIITGTIGDLINVGSNGYTGEISATEIIVDEKPVSVYLSKALFSKACFEFRTRQHISGKSYVFLQGTTENNIVQLITKKNGTEIETEKELFTEGKISHIYFTNELEDLLICFTFPDETIYPKYKTIQEIVFTYHVTLGKTPKKGLNFNEPLIYGKLYPGKLALEQATAFIGFEPGKYYNEINYNLFNKKGFPKLYIYDCNNYPLCLNNDNTLKNRINPRNIDIFTTYSIYRNESNTNYNLMSKNQKLMVVYCYNSEAFQYFCDFDALIFTNEDAININENQYFNQYLLKEDKDTFKISFSGESQIFKVNIDITVFSGGINILTDPFDGNKYNIQRSANKYVINILLTKNSEKIDYIILSIIGKKKTYYMLKANFERKKIENSYEFISGISHLISMSPQNNTEIIKVMNNKESDIFMVNFYSLNCKFEIFKKIKKENDEIFSGIDIFDYYSEDNIYYIYDSRADDDYYEYKINILGDDSSINEQSCMLYLTSVEQTKKHGYFDQDLIIPDNTPQQIRFNSRKKHISYAYVHVDNQDDLIIKFNLIHTAQYIIKFYFEFNEGKNYTISSNGFIYLSHEEWEKECYDKDELCYIIIDITLDKTKENIVEPLFEFSVQSSSCNTAVYIPKNSLKIDYSNRFSQKYFTEINKNEIGYIFVDFYRNYGRFYAKLIKKASGETDYDESTADPLPYDDFQKKINFNANDSLCEEGCYLLISVKSDNEDNMMNNPYSILVKSTQDNNSNPPIVRIYPNENIVGSISNDQKTNEFYYIYINQKTEFIIIDLQGELVDLYINIGNNRPSTTIYDFKILTEENNSIYILTKDVILQKLREKGIEKDDIKDIYLTIGTFKNIIFNSIYSFMIHFESNLNNIVHKVKTERKVLCDTVKFIENNEDSYKCLFVIENKFINGDSNSLLIYPILKDKIASYQIYADFIKSLSFEIDFDNTTMLPTSDSQFSTDKTKLNYIYIEEGLNYENYLLVNIVSNKNTRIELMSTFYKKNNVINPDPTLSQLFFIKSSESLTFEFPKEKMIITNLVSIIGNSEIFWEDAKNNKYYLDKEENELSVTSLNDKSRKLIVSGLNKNDGKEIEFAFYLNYKIKNNQNTNELILGQSVNFVYSEDDLPIAFYTRLNQLDKDIDIYFSFYELANENNELFGNGPSLEGKLIVLEEKAIANIKSNINVLLDFSKAINFSYDPSLKSGYITINKNQLSIFNVKDNEKPYIYFQIKKLKDEKVYNKLNMQITINQNNIENPLTENIYHHGKLLESENKKEYSIKTLSKFNYLFFEFSSDNDDVTFNIENESSLSIENINKKSINGKKINVYRLPSDNSKFLKLTISKKESNNNKANFIFKYINIKGQNEYPQYIIENDEISVNIEEENNKKKYKISLYPIKDSDKLNINYLIKFVKNPKQTIAINEEVGNVIEFKNPKTKDDKLELQFDGVEQGNYGYIGVTSQIVEKNSDEFLSYKFYKLPEKDSKSKTEKGFTIVLVISIVLFVIIIGLVILLMLYKKKNRNLYDEVNKMPTDKNGLLENEMKSVDA